MITLGKLTPERAWLAEVSAVVLQQSLADLDRAYRNWFRALAAAQAATKARGGRARPRVRKPRFKRRDHKQAVRFTRNSRFRITRDGRLSLPKVGALEVRWSRPLPSDPSSVTVTLDRVGRYHASFVVEVSPVPLPPVDTAVGVDLGLTTFAALSTGEKIDNPRWLRQREKALRRSQRNMARKQKGSANRDKARRRVAHLAKSIHDAGWGQFIGMLEYKARLHGRTLVKVDQWFASSQRCSGCGHRDGPKSLKVRTWTCPACAETHDRDLNAASNVLAEGLSVAACRGHVRPGAVPAVAAEAGTALAGAV